MVVKTRRWCARNCIVLSTEQTKRVKTVLLTMLFPLTVEQVFSEESDEGGGVDETAPCKPSHGPDIEFPLQRKDIDLLIEAFRKKKVNLQLDIILICLKLESVYIIQECDEFKINAQIIMIKLTFLLLLLLFKYSCSIMSS